MFDTPLTESELDRLDLLLMEYGNEDSILGVSELDGFFTAIVSSPSVVMPSRWMPALWGGVDNQPEWKNTEQMEQFMVLVMRHMNGIVGSLIDTPNEFEALFNTREVEGKSYLIADEWCFGYVRGMSLNADWEKLPESLSEDIGLIYLHGSEDGFEILEQMTDAQIEESITMIEPAVRKIHAYWYAQRNQSTTPVKPSQNPPIKTSQKVGRNDPCICGSGKKFKQCCLH